MHKRLFPKENGFTYGIYYLAFPLAAINSLADGWRFGLDRLGVMGFNRRDHGPRDGTDLQAWISPILTARGLPGDLSITLVAMPRVFGHVFNPVSFWLCRDQGGDLRAVLCEVNNTFGETHLYLCRHPDNAVITRDDILGAEKVFHVSPFLPREGSYQFRFDCTDSHIAVWIDYFAADGQKQLITALTGKLQPLTRESRRRAFWSYPLVSLVALWRIHWHALRLLFKGVRYVPKPPQKPDKLSG